MTTRRDGRRGQGPSGPSGAGRGAARTRATRPRGPTRPEPPSARPRRGRPPPPDSSLPSARRPSERRRGRRDLGRCHRRGERAPTRRRRRRRQLPDGRRPTSACDDEAHGDEAHGDEAHGDEAHGDEAHGHEAHGHPTHIGRGGRAGVRPGAPEAARAHREGRAPAVEGRAPVVAPGAPSGRLPLHTGRRRGPGVRPRVARGLVAPAPRGSTGHGGRPGHSQSPATDALHDRGHPLRHEPLRGAARPPPGLRRRRDLRNRAVQPNGHRADPGASGDDLRHRRERPRHEPRAAHRDRGPDGRADL